MTLSFPRACEVGMTLSFGELLVSPLRGKGITRFSEWGSI